MQSSLGGITLRSLGALIVGGLLVTLAGCGDDNHGSAKKTPTAVATATPTPCTLAAPFCGGTFPLNTLPTTSYGPAWADVATSPSEFYPCFGRYALCYYANCTVKAGSNGTVSDCPCFDWFGTSYVLINGDLNLDSYQLTKSTCDADPSSCSIPNGAPVCAEINNGTFYSGAKSISTFSFYRSVQEPIGSMDCTDHPGLYSGCMTGPCFGDVTPGGDRTATIHCDCPNYDGPFQIGKKDESCDDSPQTWSAAYHPMQVPTNPCELVNGCVVDAPADSCGCPLYTSSTALPPGSGVDCTKVCQEYAGCRKGSSEIELGFTCDATLCTSEDHDLVLGACLGLQQCDLSEVFKAETAAQCSCCATQLCNCDANTATDVAIFGLNAAQRADGVTPQCDINGTLCGTPP